MNASARYNARLKNAFPACGSLVVTRARPVSETGGTVHGQVLLLVVKGRRGQFCRHEVPGLSRPASGQSGVCPSSLVARNYFPQ